MWFDGEEEEKELISASTLSPPSSLVLRPPSGTFAVTAVGLSPSAHFLKIAPRSSSPFSRLLILNSPPQHWVYIRYVTYVRFTIF